MDLENGMHLSYSLNPDDFDFFILQTHILNNLVKKVSMRKGFMPDFISAEIFQFGSNH